VLGGLRKQLGLNPPTLRQFKHYRRTDGWTTDGRVTTMPKMPCSIAVARQNSHITHSFNCLCEFFLRMTITETSAEGKNTLWIAYSIQGGLKWHHLL